MVFGALNKFANKIRDKFEALVNEEELAAVVAAAVLMASADGSISPQEKEVAFQAISSHEALRGFSQVTIRKYFDNYVNLVGADIQLANEELCEKIRTIKDRVARIRVIGIATQIANADGDFSEAERAVVEKIRKLTS